MTPAKCKYCKAEIAWIEKEDGKKISVEYSSLSALERFSLSVRYEKGKHKPHYLNCPAFRDRLRT
ncbi:MAG: hypothetical protein K9I71_10925 [Ignavibacteriales bacterium]|nr:hypothetical protein [Ignavibacteriales bacterium]MCF8438248.1 hypothetical protein [Ignavibacteriales bacterium]